MIRRTLADYGRLARFNSPAGALLLLCPTLWSLWLAADGFPGWYWLFVFVTGVVVMRAFGCVINDLTDAELDAAVARTRARPLAVGRVSRREAAAVAVFFALLAFALWLLLPPIAQWWALAALAGALIYPFSKRYIAAPQAVLGIVFSGGIPIAEAAVTNAHPTRLSFLLFVANMLWVLGYDTIYAMADRDDDRRYGKVGSTALLFGKRDIVVVSLCYVGMIVWLSGVGIYLHYGAMYQVALIAAMVAVLRFWKLYKTRDPQACMAVFHANYWIGIFVFAGVVSATT